MLVENVDKVNPSKNSKEKKITYADTVIGDKNYTKHGAIMPRVGRYDVSMQVFGATNVLCVRYLKTR